MYAYNLNLIHDVICSHLMKYFIKNDTLPPIIELITNIIEKLTNYRNIVQSLQIRDNNDKDSFDILKSYLLFFLLDKFEKINT